MDLARSLLKEFARLTNNTSNNDNGGSIAYGTAIVGDDNKKYVQLDGSSTPTPVSEATDIQNGDRVLVSFNNHIATVIGNITSPASARTATNFMKLTDKGLLIGELDEDGDIIGTGSLIAPGTYYIVDTDGNVLASFSSDKLSLGDEDATVEFCGEKCKIYATDEGLMLIYGDNAVGMRSSFKHSNGSEYRAEVVCKASNSSPVVSVQVYRVGNESKASIISASSSGVNISGSMISFNGSEAITSNKIVRSGTITAYGTISSGKYATISADVSVPSGYKLCGIREINTDAPKSCCVTEFMTDPSTNRVKVTLRNVGTEAKTVTANIEWFALYSDGGETGISQVVEFIEAE